MRTVRAFLAVRADLEAFQAEVFQADQGAVFLAAVSRVEAFQVERVPVAVAFPEVDFRRVDSLLAPVVDLEARLISRQVVQAMFRPAVTFPSIQLSRVSPAGAAATLLKTTARACS